MYALWDPFSIAEIILCVGFGLDVDSLIAPKLKSPPSRRI